MPKTSKSKKASNHTENDRVMNRLFKKDMQFKNLMLKKEDEARKKNPLGCMDFIMFLLWQVRADFVVEALRKAGASEAAKAKMQFDKNGNPCGFLVSWNFEETHPRSAPTNCKRVSDVPILKTNLGQCGDITSCKVSKISKKELDAVYSKVKYAQP